MKPAITLQKKFSINQIKSPVFVANKNQQAKKSKLYIQSLGKQNK
jgi:hypothetical protein